MGRHEEIPAISTHIPESLLGQHGMELLLEKPDSSFAKGVAGIVCTGTKVSWKYIYYEKNTHGFNGSQLWHIIIYSNYAITVFRKAKHKKNNSIWLTKKLPFTMTTLL